ncbi:MAG: sodium-independent anion transporter [Spirochaetes bacterium GWF1_51_8]|nr:MAG: sodium-independent anion transporter [Spirochaetes bacterium GWF1_51_8]
MLIPTIFTVFKEGYKPKMLLGDLTAGVIVGIVALPLSIAFGIASGVAPEQGLITAVVAGFLVSLLSGSRVQIGGPTGAFVVIIYGIIQKYGYDGLAVATLIAGVILIILGIAKLGSVIKFIPYPVTVGFTSGIALIIFITQVRDFFGLSITQVPAEFVDKIAIYIKTFPSVNIYAVGIGVAALLIMIFWKRITEKIPGSLVAIILTTAAVHLFQLPVETIGSRFGSVPNTIPMPKFPMLSWELIVQMFPSGLTIALLAGIESLLSAVVADGMTGYRHRSNMELVAQGVANLVTPLFGGIPATGAIARTATNIKNGGKSPIAGIVHAVTLLLILLFFGKWVALIPMATLAAILMMVAYNMSELHIFIKLFRSPLSDVTVLLTTFLLTVLVDLTVAIQVGIVLASLLFMYRMANLSQAANITKSMREESDPNDPQAVQNRVIPHGVQVFEIFGTFFFGAVEKFKEALMSIGSQPKVLVIQMRDVITIDATGIRALEDVVQSSKWEKTAVVLSGVHAQPLYALQNSGLTDKIGKENLCGDIDTALKRAEKIIGETME